MDFLGFHVGLRTFKSSVAVFLCILLYFFVFNDSPVLASIAAVFTIREDMQASIYYGMGRIIGIFLSSLVTMIFIFLFPISSGQDYIILGIVPLAMIIFIPLAVRLKLNRGVVVGTATMLIIFFNIPVDNQLIYAVTRLLHTLVGVVVAIVVNRVLPNNYQKYQRKNLNTRSK